MRSVALVSLIFLLHGCSSAKQPAITAAPTGSELPGKFVWHDLLTSDPAAAQRFYAELFGWEFRPSNSEYTVVTQAGRPIGGILDTRKAKRKGVPAQWLGSVSVADVDSAVGVIKAGGGKVHWGPKSLGPRGDVALVADAHDVPFVVMRAPDGDPPNAPPDVNGWLWDELWTRDPEAATRFYEKLVSYRVSAKDTGNDRVYYVLESGGQPRAGVTRLLATDVKPTWLSYVRVADVNAMVGRVASLGGRVLIAPTPKIRDGRVALIEDPTGAAIAIQEWEPKS